MNFEHLLLTNQDGILTITVNREKKLNALNLRVIEEFKMAFDKVCNDNEIKAVIITGAGEKAFVAGADISEIAEISTDSARKFSERGQEVFAQIENCPKVVIALVNGFALGGGCELAMACHIRVATQNAKFGQPEVNLGIIPGYGGTQRLSMLVGKGKAFELMLTGDMIGAEEAKTLGLVNHVEENSAEARAKAEKIIKKIVSKAPVAIGQVIASVNDHYNFSANGYQTEANSFALCCKTEDFKEGTAAFLEKRKANFTGK